MVYMGSKNKYVKYIVPIIQNYIDEHNITIFIDCFCGSASVADQVNCETVIANDLSPTLIALHKQAQKDFSKIPMICTKEKWDIAKQHWLQIKENPDKLIEFDDGMTYYEIGALEWYGSYSRGGFIKGYANPSGGRNYYDEGRRNHQKQAEKENYKKIKFICGSYDNILNTINPNLSKTLLYCDSPYKGTVPYGISKKFDFDKYNNWLRETSKLVPIFISEQTMPDDFPIIWEKEAIRTTSANNNYKAVERLFFIDHTN